MVAQGLVKMNGATTPYDVLGMVDQAVFLGEEATGATSVIQSVWTYDRGVDMAGLRRFHHHLLRGRLSRRIEQSPLPFGRHRWVAPGAGPELEVAETPRPRAEFNQWLREQAAMPLDVQHGPGWRLAALPFTDGGTGLSLVISHTSHRWWRAVPRSGGRDGGPGRRDRLACSAGSRRWWRAILCLDVRHIPARRARASGAPSAQQPEQSAQANRQPTPASASNSHPAADEPYQRSRWRPSPSTSDQWDARAAAVGATSNSLLVGVRHADWRNGWAGSAAGPRSGRPCRCPSTIASRRRYPRQRDLGNVDFTIRPAEPSTTDLRGVRSGIKEALIRRQEQPNDPLGAATAGPVAAEAARSGGWSNMSVGSATSVRVGRDLCDVDAAVNRPMNTNRQQASSIQGPAAWGGY